MAPSKMPIAVEIPTATNPTSKEIRAPNSIRLSTSRPSPSVPIQCVLEGASRISLTLKKSGSYGAINGASIANINTQMMIIKPANASGFDSVLRKIFFCIIPSLHHVLREDLPMHRPNQQSSYQ